MSDSTLLQKLAEAEKEIAALREQVKRLRETLRKIATISMLPSDVKQIAAEAYISEE